MEIYGGKISYASELATAISFGSAVFLFSFHENKKLRASALWRLLTTNFLMQINLQRKFFVSNLRTSNVFVGNTTYIFMLL